MAEGSRAIQQTFEAELLVEHGALRSTLQRLEQRGNSKGKRLAAAIGRILRF
jgi:hypothetical protein